MRRSLPVVLGMAAAAQNHDAIERQNSALMPIMVAVVADQVVCGAALGALVTIPLKRALTESPPTTAISAAMLCANVRAVFLSWHHTLTT